MDERASGQITSSRTGMLKGRRKRQVWRSCKLLSMTGFGNWLKVRQVRSFWSWMALWSCWEACIFWSGWCKSTELLVYLYASVYTCKRFVKIKVKQVHSKKKKKKWARREGLMLRSSGLHTFSSISPSNKTTFSHFCFNPSGSFAAKFKYDAYSIVLFLDFKCSNGTFWPFLHCRREGLSLLKLHPISLFFQFLSTCMVFSYCILFIFPFEVVNGHSFASSKYLSLLPPILWISNVSFLYSS